MTILGSDIKAQAESCLDAGTTIATASAIIWTNDCMREMGADCRVPKTSSLTVTTASTYVTLPADFLELFYVEDSDGEDYVGNIEIRNSKIKLDSADTFTLNYFPVPTELTTISGTVSVHSLLKGAVGYFVASRYKSQDDDENKDAARLMNEYMRAKSIALTKINQSLGVNNDYIVDCYGFGGE